MNISRLVGQVVQGHDAAGPDQPPQDGELWQPPRAHPEERARVRLWKLQLHGRQQPGEAEGVH